MIQDASNLISLLNREKETEFKNKQNNVPSVTVKNDELIYFNKLTNHVPIAQYTVLSAIYTFLLKRLADDFDGAILSSYEESNLILLSLPINLELSFKEYLQKVKPEILEKLSHSNFNKEIITENKKSKNISHLSNYSINFNSDSVDNNGILVDIKINDKQDLEFQVYYSEGFVNESIIEYLVQHFRYFIINLEDNIEVNLSKYALLSDNEKNQLVIDFNTTEVDYPKNKTIVDLFEEQVVKTPNNTAVVFQKSQTTYKELNEKSNQLAYCISSEYTINKGDIIGVFLPKSDSGIIALLAILKLGAVYLPIDTNYPQERINYLIKDSGLKLLICDDSSVKADDCSILNTNQINLEDYSNQNINKEISPKDLAYIIYTSGSTGQPKGVMVEHGSNINMSLDQIRTFTITEDDKVVWFASVSFDASISEIMMSLYSGAVLCVPTEETIKDNNEFVTFLKQTKSTVVTFPPSYLGLLSLEDISGLRCIITAGESANPSKALEIVAAGIDYYNAYGPTECAVCVSMYKVTDKDAHKSLIPIGRPISNTQIYILDEALQPLPIGVIGKLYVSGVGVSRGYLNKPELTLEKFLTNPFLEGERMYDTGDLACWLPDGNIEFLGRKDSQVKMRGYRIELGEIENIILQFSENIKQIAVEVKEYNNDQALVAYFVSATVVDKSQLRDFLQKNLPEYMVPGFYVALEKLPLTPNGKIDRKALPNIKSEDVIRKEYVAPTNKTQEIVVSIWKEILGIETIGVTDNFFELGGHSLMISQVINRIHKQLGKTISFKTFFTNPTINELSLQLKDNAYLSIPKASEAPAYPLTASQNRLWILSQLEGGSLAYNMPAAVKLTGAVDFNKLQESFKILIGRYEILRTYFKINEQEEVQQYILPFEQVDLKIEEKDFSTANNQELEVSDYLREKTIAPFDLEKAPLLRASLIKLKSEEHVFFLTLHHIIGDGWSVELLLSEVIKTYNTLINGQIIDLPQLTIQYKDYAVWLNEGLFQEKYLESEHYWLKQFEGELPVLDLPSFKTRPTVQTYNGDQLSHDFSKEFLEKIKQFSKEQDVTLFVTLMSAVNTLLHRYTNQNDIIVGTPMAGREHPDLENQMGLFLNTSAIRTQFKENSTFLDLLKTQKENLLEAFDHQNYPFDALVGKLNLKKDISRSALFDILVVLQNQSQLQNFNQNQGIKDLKIETFEFENKTAQFDIKFNFSETESLKLEIEYNTDVYEANLIQRMLIHFERLIENCLVNPNLPIKQVDYLLESEKNHLINSLNATYEPYPEDKTVLDLFEEQVSKTPDNIALVFNGKQLTYRDFNEKANQLSHFLKEEYKIEKNDLVGIQLDRSEKMLISIFGILKSGGAYVPIDVHYPQSRTAFILKDGGIKFCIDESEFDKFDLVKETYSKESLPLENHTQNLAYCIYTSGSTGNPKGVLNHHAGLFNRLVWMQEYLKVNEDEVFLQKTPYTFDVSVWELILPFITGSKLVIAQPEGHKDTSYLESVIEQEKVTITHFVPSMLGVFLQETNAEKNQSLKHIVCSGEELPVVMVEKCKEKFANTQLHNLYGPTEAAIDVTAINLTKVDVAKEGVSIGKPIANTSIYIVNNSLQLQPFGVEGELLISGIQVARGYLNLPELTQDKFISDPFREGHQVYRTGDIAQWNPDGSIKYIGRIDNQVKIRGNRIELGEIEKAILDYEDISSTVVVPKEVNDQKVLVAYYVSKKEIDKTGIRSYLQVKVPEFMVPSFYVSLAEMPLTSSGKIDRKLLPAITSDDVIRKEYVGPNNATEEQLVSIWEEILAIHPIGVTDNFFELGGDSIRAIRLLGRINKALKLNYKLSDIYINPSIKELLSLQSERAENKTSNELRQEVQAGFDNLYNELDGTNDIISIFPMSDIELGMIYESLSNTSSGIYHDQFIFPIPTKNFDQETFLKAVVLLVEKHEILRTKYDIENYSIPVHLVHKQLDVKLDFEDISLKNNKERYSHIHEFMSKERIENPFNISESDLWRMKIYKTDENEWHLLFQFHHAILDGWSVASLITELNNTYFDLQSKDGITSLNKLDSTYKEYVFEQNCIKKDEKYNSFWEGKLQDYKKLDIFTDIQYSRRHDYLLSGKTYSSIQKFSKKHGISIKTITFAAYLYTLKMLTYDNDVLVGLVTNGRPLSEDGDKILGCFLNTTPFRIKEVSDSSLSFVKEINELLITQKDFEDISLYELNKRFSTNSRGENPFFDTHFNFIDFHIYDQLNAVEIDGAGEHSSLTELNFEATNTFLDLSIRPVKEGITVSWNQQRKLKSEKTIDQLQAYYTTFLTHLVSGSTEILNNDLMLLEEEKHHLINGLNATYEPYSEDKTVLDLFEEQVSKTPDNIALVFNGKQLTYRDFNEKANQLSHFLKEEYKIEKNDLVGIQLDRSEKMLISIFGILKSGGAYVPIDVHYPQSRTAFILKDGGIKFCIDESEFDKFDLVKETYSKESLPLENHTQNLAYCIYTSGSTGNPKGVLNHHAGLFNRLVWMQEYLKVNENEVFLQKTPYTFDVSVWELILPFITGSKLVIAQPEGHKDTSYLESVIEQEKVTITHFVPSMLGVFLQETNAEKNQSLQHIVCSGEELPVVMVEKCKEKFANTQLHNLYGPTEAAIDVTAINLTKVDVAKEGVSIGKPIANTSIYIVNDSLQLQPFGVEGELLISGIQVARGYLNLPELTQDKFISDPFREGHQVYRTGDIAQWNPDGSIKYIGRIDNQVKIRGNRIELGEIEKAILDYEDISSTVVVPKEVNDQKVLVAYYVSKKEIDKTGIRSYLQVKVPEFMVPSFYVSLAEMPLTSSGKIDRKLLPAITSDDVIRKEYVGPNNATEEQLVSIWEEILAIHPIGVTDNFFELGGTSFQLIRLQKKIELLWPQRVLISDLFEFNSIRDIASFINKESNQAEELEKEEIKFFEI